MHGFDVNCELKFTFKYKTPYMILQYSVTARASPQASSGAPNKSILNFISNIFTTSTVCKILVDRSIDVLPSKTRR